MGIFITLFYDTIKSPYFLFIVLMISSSIKIYYVSRLFLHIISKKSSFYPLCFLSIAITSAIVCDISWFLKLIQAIFIPMPYYIVVFSIRFAWAFLLIQYYALSLFLESLTNARFSLQKKHIPISIITALFSGYFFMLACFHPFTLATENERNIARASMNALEFFVMRHIVVYLLGIFIGLGLFAAYKNIKNKPLPKILRKQFRLFILFFIIPYIIVEFILSLSFNAIHEMLFVVSISALLLAVAIYYCLHKVLTLRFINSVSRVQEPPKQQILGHFKAVLEQLSNTKNIEELSHITQSFFKEAFALPTQSVRLIIQDQHSSNENIEILKNIKQLETFIHHHTQIYQHIFVYDEIAFNHFHNETKESAFILQFLDIINADVFLPIYSNKHGVGAIIIERNTRTECFNHTEQDAMVAFANYLGNIINLFYRKNLDNLILKEKKLKDQIYIKHQEINHYKESIQAFLRHSKEKALGIIFYKNGRFTAGNHDAEKIIHIDLNEQVGHPIAQAFKHVVHYVQTYNGPYNHYTRDLQNFPLILSGVPHLKQQSVIITVTYPDISDIVMQQMYLLHNPTDWDYLLYLSSTKTGSLINDLIPSSGEVLLNTKIGLLKAALNKKTLLIDAPNSDILSIAQLIHTINQREKFYTIELTDPIKSPDIPAMIFGNTIVNPQRDPLLKTLDGGTLFIKNIHFLDKKTQDYLAEYILYGLYRIYDTEQKIPSNTRIICSTNQNLLSLVQDGTFSAILFDLLKQATVTIPSLVTLGQQELNSLIDGYSDLIIATHPMKNLFELNDKEKQKIIEQSPISLFELKTLLEQLIINKTEEASIYFRSNTFDHIDTDFIEAARLGKHALKHPHLMQKLWEKFKNQNKIALLLGVNRSSVNRRFKLYNIGDQPQGVI